MAPEPNGANAVIEDECPRRLEKFVDAKKLLALIEDVKTAEAGADERMIETFRKTIDQYQEQPELLDPHLPGLIGTLIRHLEAPDARFHTTFKLLYQLIKVSGFKSADKRFPHDTDKLPLVVDWLSRESPSDKENWQTRFVLTVWLSIAVLTPFHLSRFDAPNAVQPLAKRIYNLLQTGLNFHNSCQHVTAYCLARFLARPDATSFVKSFTELALGELSSVKSAGSASSSDDIELIGQLRTLAYLFKLAGRDQLRPLAGPILGATLAVEHRQVDRELVCHLTVKLVQRVGLSLLPQRSPTWRHRRAAKLIGEAPRRLDEQPEEETDQTPAEQEHLEQVISALMAATQNPRTRIRWSGAKGVARVAARLSRDMAGQVLEQVLAGFGPASSSVSQVDEFAWHGGCLTLAEMARSGLILEERVGQVLQVVAEAIVFDKIKGSFPVGGHVREAACYVCWALARAYDEHHLSPHLHLLTEKLLQAMLFDRELQCRRAASATFQELVGRQGACDNELDQLRILQKLDYQSLGRPQTTYLQLALEVAALAPSQVAPLAQHLLDFKVAHWDVQVRRLASQCLASLTLHLEAALPDVQQRHLFIRSRLIEPLLASVEQSAELPRRHGALLALARLITSLRPLGFPLEGETKLLDLLGAPLVARCEPQLKSKQHAANFAEAICQLICAFESAQLAVGAPSGDDETGDTLSQWERVVWMALDSDRAELRHEGALALLALYRTHHAANKSRQDALLSRLNKQLDSLNESSRCGALRSLAKLSSNPTTPAPIKTDADLSRVVLMSLVSYLARPTLEPASETVFALAKVEACESLVEFAAGLAKSQLIGETELLAAGLDALLINMEDATFDQRGDIGVQVRKAALGAALELVLHLAEGVSCCRSLLEAPRLGRLAARFAQQAVSYNNGARELAGRAFYKLLTCSSIPDEAIEDRRLLLELLQQWGPRNEDEASEFSWRDQSTPLFVRLLSRPHYARDVWLGLIPALGQVSESFASQFRRALADYLRQLEQQQQPHLLHQILAAFLDTLAEQQANGRLATAGLTTIEFLANEGLLDGQPAELQRQLLAFCKRQASRSQPRATAKPAPAAPAAGSELKRLLAVVEAAGALIQLPEVQRDSLLFCIGFLTNGFARVRVFAGEQLYQALSTLELAEQLDQNEAQDSATTERALDLLSSTVWSQPLDKVKAPADQLASLLATQLQLN